MSRKGYIIILILIAFSLIYYSFYVRFNKSESEFDIRKFRGNVISVSNETITLSGFFIGEPGQIPEDSIKEEFTFKVDEGTKFEKIETQLPTIEEILAAGGNLKYKLEDRPKTKGPGSFDDLKNSFSLTESGLPAVIISIEVDFQKSIYNSKNPVASFVLYNILIRK